MSAGVVRSAGGGVMRWAIAALVLALWLAGTAYLAIAALWIVGSTQWKDPPVIYLGGLAVVIVLWAYGTKAVANTIRKLWQATPKEH